MRRIATITVSAAALLAFGASAVNAATPPIQPTPVASNVNRDSDENKPLANALDKVLGSSDPGDGPVAETQDAVGGLTDSLHGLLG
ncbi:hypothetical protein [Streptomyces sp. NPDC001415]